MLDRETKSTYNLVVTARDCAKDVDKRLSSTVQVRFPHFRFLRFKAITAGSANSLSSSSTHVATHLKFIEFMFSWH